MAKRTKKEFIERVMERVILAQARDKKYQSKMLKKLLDNIHEFSDFEEVHGCEFAHGQYGKPNNSRTELLKMYLKDHYPNRKFEFEFDNPSLVFARIKKKKIGE